VNADFFFYLKKYPELVQRILVGGLNPSEKYEFVGWGYEIPNINGQS